MSLMKTPFNFQYLKTKGGGTHELSVISPIRKSRIKYQHPVMGKGLTRLSINDCNAYSIGGINISIFRTKRNFMHENLSVHTSANGYSSKTTFQKYSSFQIDKL